MNTVSEARAHLRAVPDLAPGASPEAAPAPERRFFVIEGGIDRAAQFLRLLGATLIVTIIVGLVGALAVHATIIKNQQALDQRQERIDQLSAETETMRHELAMLEAPARIVAEARDLGMIDAPSVTYLHNAGGLLEERALVIAENQLLAG